MTIYMWREGWGPGANTIAYFPFETDSTDHSTNNISVTTNGSISYTTLASGKKVANFGGYTAYTNTGFYGTYLSNHVYTVNYWYTVNKNSNCRRNQFQIVAGTGGGAAIETGTTTLETNSGGYTQLYYYTTYSVGSTSHSGWLNACVTFNGTSAKLYINGVLYTSHSTSNLSSGLLGIGFSNGSSDYHNGYMSEFIVENKVRTDQEIIDYYNQTKGLYGIN